VDGGDRQLQNRLWIDRFCRRGGGGGKFVADALTE
jgi:hypothetical protein